MNRKLKVLLMIVSDIVLINLAYQLAFYLRFENFSPLFLKGLYIKHILIVTFIKISIYYMLHLYKSIWKYASIEELMQITAAIILSNGIIIVYGIAVNIGISKSIYMIVILLDLLLIGLSRFTYRSLQQIKKKMKGLNRVSRVMIIGAGDAGESLVKELKKNKLLKYQPVALIDDDKRKIYKRIHGITVLGQTKDIVKIAKEKNIQEIIIAIPSADKRTISNILRECKKTRCKIRRLPPLKEIMDRKIDLNLVRDVEIEDLLGREEIRVNYEEISGYLTNKRILVTGAGGSIGSEICRQLIAFHPKELAILDINENSIYELQFDLKRIDDSIKLRTIIASIRDRERLEEIADEFHPEVIFHAAAHKHVPLMEINPKEAIKNNVFGTLNLIETAEGCGVDRFVMISTDKAVNPTNIMGASKRICEMLIQSKNKISKTDFVAVRFGNVLGSNGSVIPLFKKQISQGGPVTVTHREVIRYFMTIFEATQLVIQAGTMAAGGEIFVLDMGEPVKIMSLAEDLIRLSGFEPYVDIPIEIVGLREGEKLFEELILDHEDIIRTKNKKIFIGKAIEKDYRLLEKDLLLLTEALKSSEDTILRRCITQIVPEYRIQDKRGPRV